MAPACLRDAMRLAALAALAWIPLAVPLSAQADAHAPALAIAEVLPDPDTGAREFVELANRGNATVNLQGWKVRDASGNTFTFGTWHLPPQARVVVWGGGSATAAGPAWSQATAWNNAGDTVHLLAPDGTQHDAFQYGTTQHPAPGKGVAWVLRDGWSRGTPTPGHPPDAVGGSLAVTVENVAPTATFTEVPAAAKPGATVQVAFLVADGNGDADIAGWSIGDGQTTLAQGTGTGSAATLTAPPTVAPWTLTLTAQDAAGASATSTALVLVQDSPLVVRLPDGGAVPFPPLPPGGRAMAAASVTIENAGPGTVTPLVDVSDFQGPATIPSRQHLVLHVSGDVEAQVPYTRALQALPPLAPQARIELGFELLGLPQPLPPGNYGTSFSVVAS